MRKKLFFANTRGNLSLYIMASLCMLFYATVSNIPVISRQPINNRVWPRHTGDWCHKQLVYEDTQSTKSLGDPLNHRSRQGWCGAYFNPASTQGEVHVYVTIWYSWGQGKTVWRLDFVLVWATYLFVAVNFFLFISLKHNYYLPALSGTTDFFFILNVSIVPWTQ